MKTLLLFFILAPLCSLSQSFSAQNFSKTQELASKEHKIILVLLYSGSCIQCNEVADRGMASQEVKDKLQKNEFILLAYHADDKDGVSLRQKFNVTAESTSLLFISPSGNLLHKMNGSTTFGRTYVAQMDRALNNLTDEKAYLEFEKAYQSGSKNLQLLEQLMVYRSQMGRESGDVLDTYCRALPPDSLSSLILLQKIARSAPELGTYSDSILHSNADKFSEAWYRMPLQERVNINNRIIAKTKATAIATKDQKKIFRLANFTAAITGDVYQKRRMPLITYMDYYKAIGDTANYLPTATLLMETLVMKISPDSIKRVDSLKKEKMRLEAMQVAPDAPGASGPVTSQRSFTFAPSTQYYSNDLNSVAFEFYKITNNPAHLANALRWSARSLAFFDASSLHDTYARLLYKTGSRDSAIIHQQIAVDLEKKRGFPATEFEKVLQRMKAGEIKVDDY